MSPIEGLYNENRVSGSRTATPRTEAMASADTAAAANEFCPRVETELCPWLDDFDGAIAKYELHERSGCGHGTWATEEL